MNRTTLFRSLSLGLASLALATGALAGTLERDQLTMASELAEIDAQVAVTLQAWSDQRDIELLAQADGLITNDMRAAAEAEVVAQLAEADGLITTRLREQIDFQAMSLAAATDGMTIKGAELALSMPESSPATRNIGAVLVASKSH